jgi:hypothetical protein
MALLTPQEQAMGLTMSDALALAPSPEPARGRQCVRW